jgi:hypothetical protein
VNLYDLPTYHPGGEKEFLVIAPILDGDHGSYRHVMKVDYGKSHLQQPLTQGTFEVKEIHGWDKSRQFM